MFIRLRLFIYTLDNCKPQCYLYIRKPIFSDKLVFEFNTLQFKVFNVLSGARFPPY